MRRREWLSAMGAGFLPLIGCRGRDVPESAIDEIEPLAKFPGKVPMRVVNDSPPCLETPWKYYRDDFTPNNAFYVRWHLRALPTSIDANAWRLRIDGEVERPTEWSLKQLKGLEQTTIAAVNQCSGNSRGFHSPRVPGAQWKNGGLGNARWTGVRLKDLLDRAGVKKKAVEVEFDGLDKGPLESVPDFVKALTIDQARSPEILVATEMNGEPLPLLNGFPARLVVPGHYATYWVKALRRITVLDHASESYWMTKAYKIPDNPDAAETKDNLAKKTRPIHRMNVRSFLVSPEPHSRLAVSRPCTLDGIAFDGGSGIRKVELSFDGGGSWSLARLGEDHGGYSFRRWKFDWTPEKRGKQTVLVRASNREGRTQPEKPTWNRGGFMRNAIEHCDLYII